MRTPVLVAVVACSVFVCPPVVVVAQPVGLRVLHWNVLHSGSGTDRVLNRARQVSWIVRYAPDIVTLNEVTASAADDYRAQIAAATKQTWHLHHVAAVRDSDGNAILARYPMVAKGGRLLTRARSVTQATIEVAGTSVNVFATHLESGGEREARAEQARLLVPYLASFPAPHIVNGDFNAGPDRDEIQPLLGAYVDAWAQAFVSGTAVAYLDNPPSRYTRTRGARIDYILTSPEIRIDGCEIPDLRDFSNPAVQTRIRTSDDRGVRPSDHNLVVCICKVKS